MNKYWDEDCHKGWFENKGNAPVAGVAGMEGAPDLLDSFNFFSLSAYVVRTAEKFCHQKQPLVMYVEVKPW